MAEPADAGYACCLGASGLGIVERAFQWRVDGCGATEHGRGVRGWDAVGDAEDEGGRSAPVIGVPAVGLASVGKFPVVRGHHGCTVIFFASGAVLAVGSDGVLVSKFEDIYKFNTFVLEHTSCRKSTALPRQLGPPPSHSTLSIRP